MTKYLILFIQLNCFVLLLLVKLINRTCCVQDVLIKTRRDQRSWNKYTHLDADGLNFKLQKNVYVSGCCGYG